MTATTPPIYLQAGSHPAELVRRSHSAIFHKEGITTSGALVVSQKSGTPNMSVDVAEGQLVLAGDEATYQGHYVCEARGVTNLVIAAADPTNPRRDLIIARVRDSAYSGATDTFSLEVVQGTPAGSPSDPSLPTGSCYVLARVAVAASAASIVNANVTDGRSSWTGQFGRAAALGGTITCTSTTRPTGVEGLKIYETDTDLEYTYNGSVWVLTAGIGTWASYTPTVIQSGAVTKTVTYARYFKVGRTVTFVWDLALTSSGTANNLISISLPVAAVATNVVVGRLIWFDATDSKFWGTDAFCVSGSTLAGLITSSTSIMGQTSAGWPNQVASGDVLRGFITYEASS